jgi:hypothetical protein
MKGGYEKETLTALTDRAELIEMLVECILDRKMKEFQMGREEAAG